MSKSYKKKKEQEEVVIEETRLSKKELYDLEKQKKLEQKEKDQKKKEKAFSKKKKMANKKTYQTNLAGRIFAVVMLILMIGSVMASVAAYLG